MTNRKSTKKALLTSVLALLLCFSMLIGTTFAWFTDSVTSGVNQIIAGNLDVEVYYGDPADKNSITEENVLFDEIELWEPGVVAYENITVVNEGNLALKYQMSVNFDNENYLNGLGLSDVLQVAVVPGGVSGTREQVLAAAGEGVLLSELIHKGNLDAKNHTSDTYGIVIWWEPSDADNNWNVNNGDKVSDYTDEASNYLHIDLGIQLVATQLTNEHDSFGNDYDAEADGPYSVLYTFDNAADLNAFDPIHFKPENTAGSGLSVEDGKAVVDAKGAFYYQNVNLNKYDYTIEYDVDTSAMAEGDIINFETGDTDTWAGTNYITVKKGSSIVSIGPAANNPTGYVDNVTLGEQLHVVHTYSFNAEGKLVTTTTISDGENTVTASKTVDSAATQLYWDVYDLSENAGGKVTLDNFAFYAEKTELNTAGKLEAALAEGGEVVLTQDITAVERIEIPEGVEVTLNLNGHNLTTDSAIALYSMGDLTITGKGSITSTYSNYAIRAQKGSLLIDTDDLTVIGEFGAISIFNGANVTINGGSYMANGINGKTSHTVYVSNSTLTINGGTFDSGYSNEGIGTITGSNSTVSIYGGAIYASELGESFYMTNVTIYGGAYQYDPTTLPANKNNKVAEGYKVTQVGDLYYVTAETTNVVSDGDTLVEALESGNDVIFTGDVKIDPAGMSNAYGTTGINVKNGQTIDGNGGVLDIQGAGGTWDSGISTTGGTIKNLTVTGSFRGIFINHNSEESSPVILENVIIDGTVYTVSCDQGSYQTLKATDCTFNGWTSYAATLGSAEFINCSFGEGSGYAFCRPYARTTFVGCDFEAGFEIDPRAAVTFENCTIGGVALTAENLATLVTSNIANATVK